MLNKKFVYVLNYSKINNAAHKKIRGRANCK